MTANVYSLVKEALNVSFKRGLLGGKSGFNWLRDFVLAPLVVSACFLCSVQSGIFNEVFHFSQPDGTPIQLHGEGHDFYSVFETMDGYTVFFDPGTRAYFFAVVSEGGGQLKSSGVQIHQGDPQKLGLAKHLRISPAAVRRQTEAGYQQCDAALGLSARWNELKAWSRETEANGGEGSAKSPPASPTIGTKVGLTLLVDFADTPATISQSEINNLCNGDNYTGYGNNGSVKQYFYDNSNGKLIYSNVVTIYVRMAYPKSYYDDSGKYETDQARALINEALATLKSRADYSTTILPTFASLTTDSYGVVKALNVFYAGTPASPHGYGLWPHKHLRVAGRKPAGAVLLFAPSG